jgi:tetratricopeptide (TPR) repeat protein
MRTVVCGVCLALTLSGQQRPSDGYASAIAKYVAGNVDAALDALESVPHADAQREIEASLRAVFSNAGSTAAHRRLEVIAMLHTEYPLLRAVGVKDALFHIDMAHLALFPARSIIAAQEPKDTFPGGADLRAERQRAREWLPRWCALATSVLLTYANDTMATSITEDTLKLLPDDERVLFWRARVLEYHAVWVGTPAIDPRPAAPAMRSPDGAGFDMVTNARVWGRVEEGYRRVLQRDPNHFEAHLHRGYALYALRKYNDAKTEYELARDRSTDPSVVYVADLLLARLKEDQHDLKGAVQDYEHALATMPGAQDAYVGLGSVKARLGNAQDAREVTERLAAIPEKRRVRDPWWAFHTTRVPDDDLNWLWQAVRR